jgi:tRNA(fMet)-specific endonuclease VapC
VIPSAELDRLEQLVRQLVVVQLDQGSILSKYAEIVHFTECLQRPARPMGQNDIWIAATAAATGAWLVSADKDFDHLEPTLIRIAHVDARTGVVSTKSA